MKISDEGQALNAPYSIKVMDISGKEIFKDFFKGKSYQLNRSHLSEGIFFLSLSRNGVPIGVKKLVVN